MRRTNSPDRSPVFRGGIVRLRGLAVVAVLLAGCSDDPVEVTGSKQTLNASPATRTLSDESAQGYTAEFPAIRRVALDIQATGSFRPGHPVIITSRARANRSAADVEY